ncbi:MAG TPA: rhodanese-like domain-containing protein [Myxococcota bacterium]|nr:rhodanese-like domain-containing protein [Myxococcota bacterium]
MLFASLSGCLLFAPPELIQLTPQEFHDATQGVDVVLVDVHIPEQTHIEGTDALVPYNEILDHLDEFPEDRSEPIYLYCRSGHMVNPASRDLFDEGYTTIYNLDGGTIAWEEASLPY